ncbi:MAG TPA: LLM class flavin-dependent oxidoreductase [Chloroflexota bacterium]|jgi:alkanesulfonate monooxygenase SsuD/methylene tetrahydromethanopterin reductase-like flavin-dependent oxidoreductase (luciferase family)
MTNPLFGPNRLKLGVFGANLGGGCTATMAEGTLEATWPATLEVARLADEAGIEAMVPVARWKGFGGPTNFNAESFETYTWAAGLGAQTKRIAVFATSHVPTVHPIVAAKQATTIDHITGGRFALNVVCGWFEPEFAMFGRSLMDHETRYEYAAEWLDVMLKLWTCEDEFDFEGRYFKVEKGFHQPKPIQKPYPPIMNAGRSGTGNRFAAKYSDMIFTSLWEYGHEDATGRVNALRKLARDEFGREIQVWTTGFVICRPTEREARDYLHYVVEEKGDWEAMLNLQRIQRMDNPNVPEAELRARRARMLAGYGGHPLIGTPEQITDTLSQLSRTGIDGIVISWVNYQDELRHWISEVMPLLVQAGLRTA